MRMHFYTCAHTHSPGATSAPKEHSEVVAMLPSQVPTSYCAGAQVRMRRLLSSPPSCLSIPAASSLYNKGSRREIPPHIPRAPLMVTFLACPHGYVGRKGPRRDGGGHRTESGVTEGQCLKQHLSITPPPPPASHALD